jgi:hypothetical protein
MRLNADDSIAAVTRVVREDEADEELNGIDSEIPPQPTTGETELPTED